MTTYNAFGGYGHPDHIRTHDVAVRAFDAGRRPGLVSRAASRGAGGLDADGGCAVPKLYEQAIPASVRDGDARADGGARQAELWCRRPRTRRPSRSPSSRSSRRRCWSRTRSITTWVDISGAPLDAKWAAIHEHVTQISDDSPFMLLGLDGWRDGWAKRGVHPARVAGRVGAARDGPLRRDRLGRRGRARARAHGPRTATRAAAPSTRRTPGPSRPCRRRPGRGSWAGPCPG